MASPPPDVGSRAGIAAPTPNPANASAAGRGTALPGGAAPVDHADIRPLDLAGALQILIAEVRAALVETLIADISETSAAGADAPAIDDPTAAVANPVGGVPPLVDDTVAAGNSISSDQLSALNLTPAGNAQVLAVGAAQDIDGPVPAARAIVDLVLRSLPDTFEPNTWSVALPRVDLALQSGVQRAMDAVSVWRDVPPAVVAAAQESANLALTLIADEPIYPWPPAEWMGMAPRLGLLWRRRRFLKRRLVDPDYGSNGNWDDLNDPGGNPRRGQRAPAPRIR